ncbi:MAG: hypothetical protein ACYCQI_14105 [Gammaproteobacteria bacterium]
MTYRILVSVVLLNILSTVFAIDRPVASTAVKSIIDTDRKLSRASNSADPYQYCFNNSTWVVPPQTLLAYLYNNGAVTAVSDQTVWVFSSYNQGYFSGQSYTAINNSILSKKYLIGSVTSAGKVLITFYSGTSTSTDLVSGIGDLSVKSSGQCSFTMQMNSGQNGVSGLTHWSYMLPVNPGDIFYNNLPGTQMSVPQFLSQF